MFRLAAFTDEISQDLAHACRIMNELGAVGAEIRGVWNVPVQKLSDSQVRDIARIVSGHGCVVCSVASPFGKCELEDPAQVAEHMDILRRCADIGLALDCNLVRGFAFWGHGATQKPWDAMRKAYEPVPGILEEKRVVLGLENEAACYVGTAGHTRMFLDMLGCARIKAIWDPANHVQDPEGDTQAPFPNAYELIAKDIVHVHVKDAIVAGDGSRPNVFLGEGICHWQEQFAAFHRDGYAGFVSLETHVDAERFPETLRAQYGAHLAGEGREGASKVCLAWMRDALGRLA